MTMQSVFRLPRRALLLATLLFGFLSVAAHAQYDTGAVLGTVKDASGGVVVNAIVVLHDIDKGTSQRTETTSGGEYSFPSAQVGNYFITTTARGFEALKTEPFELVVNARRRVDLPLQISGTTVVVNVNASAVNIDTDSSDRGTVVDRQEVSDLPLNGREYTDLALLAPGVQVSALQTGDVEQRRGSFNTNGMRSTANNFLLDGLDNNSYQIGNQGFNNQAMTPSVDSVQEFKIVTANFPAQYGRAGGSVINVTTRSGSNKLHVSAWEFIRNTAFDAYGPLVGTGVKPSLVQNQFGGAIGGRIERDKSFFFLDYEGFRQVTGSLRTATVPTDDQRAGIFTAAVSATGPSLVPLPIKNPLTGVNYPDGKVPLTAMMPFARAVVDALPRATSPGFDTNFGYNGRGQNTRDTGSLRLDRNFGTRIQAFVRISQQMGHIQQASPIPGLAGNAGDGKPFLATSRIATGFTWQVSPRAILDTRFGATQFKSGKFTWNYGQPSFFDKFGIPYPVDTRSGSTSVNSQVVSGMTAFGAQNTSNLRQDPTVYNPKISYTVQRGAHTLSVGYEYIAVNMYSQSGRPIYGSDTYNASGFTLGSGPQVPASTTARTAALNFAAFLFGARSEYEFGNFAPLNQRYRYHAAYFQDDWRALPGLTLNIGLRYELSIPVYERNNKLANFDPTTKSLIIAKNGSLSSRSLRNIDWNDFAPRFGFAYQMYPRLVWRGAYGISYMEFNRDANASPVFNGPFLIDTDILQGALPTGGTGPNANQFCPDNSESLQCFRSTQQGYPTSMISSQAFDPQNSLSYYSPQNVPTGYIQSYNLGFQYRVDSGTIVDIAYVGSHGVHLIVLSDYNQATPQTVGGSLSLAARRPISNFLDISTGLPAGFLAYNSLQAKMQRKQGSLFLLNSFSYSQARDLASADGEASHGDSTVFNLYDSHYDEGVSGYNQPFNNSTAVRYSLPRIHTTNSFAKAALNGWRFTTVTRITSGFPVNVTYTLGTANKISNLGYAMRPNLVKGKPSDILKDKSLWVRDPNGLNIRNVVDSSYIAQPAVSAPFGTLSRNSVRFLPRFSSDLGLQKVFNLREGVNLQFRAEAFNWTNHTNWNAPSANLSATAFGQITSAAASRQIQFAIRLDY